MPSPRDSGVSADPDARQSLKSFQWKGPVHSCLGRAVRPRDHPTGQSCLGARPGPSASLGLTRTPSSGQEDSGIRTDSRATHISSTKPSRLFKSKCTCLPKPQHLPHTLGPPACTDVEDRWPLRMQGLSCRMTIEDPELSRGISRDPHLRAKPSPASPAPSFRCFGKAPPYRAYF